MLTALALHGATVLGLAFNGQLPATFHGEFALSSEQVPVVARAEVFEPLAGPPVLGGDVALLGVIEHSAFTEWTAGVVSPIFGGMSMPAEVRTEGTFRVNPIFLRASLGMYLYGGKGLDLGLEVGCVPWSF